MVVQPPITYVECILDDFCNPYLQIHNQTFSLSDRKDSILQRMKGMEDEACSAYLYMMAVIRMQGF